MNPLRRLVFLLLGVIVSAANAPIFAAPEPLALVGNITNTTHALTAPARFELTFNGDAITGFITIDPPWTAGRWPVEGTRRGPWCEIVCHQTPTTRVIFRGVLSATELRGTTIFGGGGELVQYGRFQVAVVAAAPSAATPPAPATPPPAKK